MMSAKLYNTDHRKSINNQSVDYEPLASYRGGDKPQKWSILWILVSVIFFFISGFNASATTVSDSLRFRIFFSVNSTTVQTELFDNRAVLSGFSGEFENLRQDKQVSDLRLTIQGSASVEGDASKNLILAGRRALAVYSLIKSSYSIDGSLVDVLPGKVLSPDENSTLELCRFAEIRVTFKRTVPEPEPPVLPVVEPVVESTAVATAVAAAVAATVAAPAIDTVSVIAEPVEEPVTETMTEPEPKNEADTLKTELRLGTNLLYDLGAVANLSLEIGFARHAAFNLSATFSHWDIRRPDLKWRNLILQPEFRWYFADNFKGHYAGVEGHYGWYNVALADKTRYQDRDGNTPLWGAGLSYGYVWAVSEHFGMDFSISAGYAKLVYDCFYNIENGAKYTTATKDWWGPTRVGISIYYQF